ncbi:MAG: leucyl aminopeptidase [Firmicutes bacterium]|nr:leucyl aminopeptidase [Bacillota bacterium]
MEVRGLVYNFDAVKDVLFFFTEGDSGQQKWPLANLQSVGDAQGFTGKFGEVFSCFYVQEGVEEPRKVIVSGLGKVEDLSLEKIRRALGKGLKEAERLKVETLTIAPLNVEGLSVQDVSRALTETALLSAYRFDRYLSEKKESSLKILQVGYEDNYEGEVLAGIKLGKTLGHATNLARNLVNEPANVLTPERLAQEAQAAGKEYGFEVEVFDPEAIEALNMTAFLEVGKASANTPRLIVMRHFGQPEQPDKILGLVGKGLTYDSGGLDIKPGDSMVTMKYDMAGSAAVIGAMVAIAQANLPLNVVAVVAACENLISGTGYRPGDVISSMAGKSILISSTDAEGRLTLADAVHYIVTEEKADTVVDVATLTGAAIIALGNTTTGVVTNNQELYAKLQQASEQSGERVWQLPSFPEYREQNKTPLADLKNTGGRPGGTITAGLFIEEFVQDKPWIHLDIAGTAFTAKDLDYLVEGGTGVGVRLLYHFATSFV